jgi:hypothetical protein
MKMFDWWPWKFKTVDEIKVWWKLWSIRLGALGTIVTTWLVSFPDQAVAVWGSLPDTVRDLIPAQYMPMIGVSIFVLSMVSRFIKQHSASVSLAEKKAEEIADAKAAILADHIKNGTPIDN